MTLTELRYLVCLAKEKHFGKAAKKCHISQPTLSIALNKIEKKLGVIIFERLPSEIRITHIGEKIIAQAERVLAEMMLINEIVEGNKLQLNSPLKVGGIYTVSPYLFPKLIPRLNRIAPDMSLIIDENFTSNLQPKLQAGDLDAIFIAMPFKAEGIITKPLYEETFVVLMRKDHPLHVKKTITANDLLNENLLLLGEDHCLRDQIIAACPGCYQKVGIQQTREGTSLETLRHMVASGLGITILPSSATQVKHYNAILCTRPFAQNPPKRTIALAWRANFPRVKAVDAIIKALTVIKLNGTCLVPE